MPPPANRFALSMRMLLSDRVAARLPFALLAVSGACAAALILYVNRTGIFYYDEWHWFEGAAHLDATKLFESDNGHLVLVPRLIYDLVLHGVGTHYLLFKLINVALVFTVSLLFFLLARRRVGDWLALVPAVFLMFFGSGWDVLASGIGINFNLGVACGLGAFLALERRTLGADLLAGGLIAAGLASQSGVIAIALGGTVMLIAQGRWRRIWVMLVPLVLYGIWNILTPDPPGGEVTTEHMARLPYSFFDSVAAAVATTTGLFPQGFPLGLPETDITLGRPLAAVAIVGLAYLLLKDRRFTVRFVSCGAVVLFLWASLAAVGRNPGTGRYSLTVLPFIFLALFELIAGQSLRWRHWVAIGAVFVLGLIPNLYALKNGGAILRYHGEFNRGAVTALELHASRAEANPDVADDAISFLSASADPYSSDMIYVTPIEYLRAAREFGSAGYPDADIASAPEYAREAADRILLAVLEPRLTRSVSSSTEEDGCARLSPGPGSVVVPPRGLTIRASSASAEVRLRRFAEVSTTSTPLILQAQSEQTLALPPDESPQPWTAEVTSAAAVVACPRRGDAPIEAVS
jgi:hypothetical protein